MTTMQREALFEPGSEDAGDRRGGVEPATVIAVEASAAGGPDAGRRAARGVVQLDRPGRPTFGAIFAQIAGYRPAPGDRVLVARGPRGERYVVAVIEATAIRAAIRPYSMAVAPAASENTFLMSFIFSLLSQSLAWA